MFVFRYLLFVVVRQLLLFVFDCCCFFLGGGAVLRRVSIVVRFLCSLHVASCLIVVG